MMDRRAALQALGLGATGLLVSGCGAVDVPIPEQTRACVPRTALTAISRLDGIPLVYEVNERGSSFPIEPGFLAQLETWQQYWREHSGLPVHDQVWTYGAWVDGGATCSSWHGAGRAFDISRLRAKGSPIVSCREDLWSKLPAEQAAGHRRRYWALAASLHLHFAYVLTYLFDAAHRNHIHVDNGVSGTGMSRFDKTSRVQNQALQAICSHLWDTPIEVTGVWDDATKRATSQVLERLERSGDAATNDDNWVALLTASVGRGGS